MNGLEQDWGNRVEFFSVDFRSPLGHDLARRFEVENLPSVLLMDGLGQLWWRSGLSFPGRKEIESRLASLVADSKVQRQ